ncbi:MAG: dienelactone hydrolase family protein [Bryobacteraceae bacterium]|nr:dienelactone hydrolase family protein [Bryobacteraceae bacterium]
MERKKAGDFPQELLDLFDRYVHGDIDRRAFLDGAQRFASGSVTAAMLWESLRPNYAWAQQVPPADPRIRADRVDVPSPQGHGSIRGYLVRPAPPGPKRPGVLVVHENRGLNPYIEDVARRLAVEGFLALAPDGLTSRGGYPGDDEKGVQLFREIDRQKLNEDWIAAARWLKSHPECTGRIGVVGFCYGGGVANMLAVRLGEELSAAVPFYGGQPPAEDVPRIRAPLLLHYAALDKRVNDGWPAYEAALKQHGKEYAVYFYENANHGFHNDTTPRYDEAAARLAWQRTLDFLRARLR